MLGTIWYVRRKPSIGAPSAPLQDGSQTRWVWRKAVESLRWFATLRYGLNLCGLRPEIVLGVARGCFFACVENPVVLTSSANVDFAPNPASRVLRLAA